MPKSKRSKAKPPSQSPETALPLDLPVVSHGLFPAHLLQNDSTWSEFLTSHKSEFGLSDAYVETLLTQKDTLQRLAKQVNEFGGWLEVVGQNAWMTFQSDSIPDPKTTYESHLFPLLKSIEFHQKYHSLSPYNVPVTQLRPGVFKAIKVFTPPESGQITQSFWNEVFNEDVAILRGFAGKIWRIEHGLLSVEYLEKKESETEIGVLMQDKDPDQEKIRLHESEKVDSTIGKFLQKHLKSDQIGAKIGTAVNIDIGSWAHQMDNFHSRLPECLLFSSSLDALRYLRVHTNGVSLPQISIQTAGSWTGATQETLGFTGIGLNHGPGESQLYAVSSQDVGKVRDMVRQELGFDTVLQEGKWWPDENWLLGKEVECAYGVVKGDDLVCIAPGTMHWSKARSPTVVSTWNIAPKSVKQFETAFNRHILNHSLGLESLIPLYSLSLDLLNYELSSLPIPLVQFLFSQLSSQYTKEKSLLDSSKLPTFGVLPGHQIRLCEKCRSEIFYTYTVSDSAYCLTCISTGTAYLQFPDSSFTRLNARVEKKISGNNEDYYDPTLNLHFNEGLKWKLAKNWVSPFKGFPSCFIFNLGVEMEENKEEEKGNTEEIETKKTQKEVKIASLKRKREKSSVFETKKKPKKGNSEVKSENQEVKSDGKAQNRRSTRSQSKKTEEMEVEEEHPPTRKPDNSTGNTDPNNSTG